MSVQSHTPENETARRANAERFEILVLAEPSNHPDKGVAGCVLT